MHGGKGRGVERAALTSTLPFSRPSWVSHQHEKQEKQECWEQESMARDIDARKDTWNNLYTMRVACTCSFCSEDIACPVRDGRY